MKPTRFEHNKFKVTPLLSKNEKEALYSEPKTNYGSAMGGIYMFMFLVLIPISIWNFLRFIFWCFYSLYKLIRRIAS